MTKAGGLDRRWIFLAMALVALIFLKVPIELPSEPAEPARDFYHTLNRVPPGSKIYLSCDYGPSSQAEILPMHERIVYHALKNDLKVIAGSFWETGPPMIDRVFTSVQEELAAEGIVKEYGIDYVNLGFRPGQDVAIAQTAVSIPATFPKDYRGQDVDTIPVMQGVENFEQTALVCDLSSGFPGVREWLHQVQKRYDVTLIAGVTAVMAPDLYAFYHSGQVRGILGGLVGAAEYEALLGRPGAAMAGMNVQSIGHLLILLLIVLGNLIHFAGRRRRKGRES